MRFGGTRKFDSQSPGLGPLAVWPGKFERHVGDGTLPHIFINAPLIVLEIAEAVTLERTVGTVARGRLVKPHEALIAYQDKLDQIHQNGFARAGNASEQQIALNRDAVLVAIPVQRMNAS